MALGTTTAQGVQFGQNIKAGEVGKTYTFAVFAKSLRAPASAHLEIERPASPWDRVVKGDNVPLKENEWTELHVTFKVEKPYPEGWFAYLASAHDGAWLRVDLFRIYEGDYVPWRATAAGAAATPAAGGPAFTDGSFETKQGKWRFTFDEQYNLRRTYRRSSFQLARLLANMGVAADSPLGPFRQPGDRGRSQKTLARRFLPRPARGMGLSVPLLLLVGGYSYRRASIGVQPRGLPGGIEAEDDAHAGGDQHGHDDRRQRGLRWASA